MKKLFPFILLFFLLTGLIPLSLAATPYRENVKQLILVTMENPLRMKFDAIGVNGQLRYRWREAFATPPELVKLAHRLSDLYGLTLLTDWPIKPLDIHCYVYSVPENIETQSVVEKLRRDTRVESAQVMNTFTTLTSTSSKDTYAQLQHSFRAMNVAAAHKISKGKNVKLAIVDTALERQHPEFSNAHIIEHQLLDTIHGKNTFHGTAVAGVVMAEPNNGEGIAGIAPAATLLAAQGCWHPNKQSTKAVCNTLSLAQALSIVIAKKSDVVNLSLTGPMDPLLKRLVQHALKQGSIVVAAHESPESNEPVFPADIEGVISVNNRNVNRADKFMLGLSGQDILTTVPKGRYDFVSGSSLASAQVAGLISLALSENPNLTNREAYTALVQAQSAETDEVDKSITYLDGCIFLQHTSLTTNARSASC